ncbi:pk1 [Peridroma alphabaculovirus]|uniref:Pk1 n=1 Tax=Peridroma alphabaculovirus TaxID=1346829 RepID=A0A068LR97_9ABAC|nr:pk1 [Peridroma alphabaculovirus]AIE47735.1 pk1 [Peridroma alphabaculovirus]
MVQDANMDSVLVELNDFFSEITQERNHKLVDGKYGKVTVWKHGPTQKLFLKKKIKIKHYNEIEPMIHSLMNNNRYYIKLYYSITTLKSHVLIMDFIKGGDLFDLLKSEGRLSPLEGKLIVGQVAEALHALHKHQIIHNDIKLENILYNRYKQIYVGDYGLCKNVGLESCYDGTVDYFSPEKIARQRYDFHFDWWALGVLAHELLTGDHPYKDNPDETLTVDRLADRQRQRRVCSKNNLDKDATAFIAGMLKYNINYRLHKYSDISKHEFLI